MAELVFYFAAEILENHLALNQPSDRRITASFTARETVGQPIALSILWCIFSLSLLSPHHMWLVECAAFPSCFLPQGCCELESDV